MTRIDRKCHVDAWLRGKISHEDYWALFRIEWKGGHAGVEFRNGLAGRSVNFPVVRKMMLVRPCPIGILAL